MRVVRDRETIELNATELVPGDVVLLKGGDIVTADCRLISASKLQANESALTGESLPVEKSIDPIAEESLLAERPCMVFKGTEIVRGSATAVVSASGMQTEIGEVTALVAETPDEKTPLEIDLDTLGRRLIYLVAGVALVIITAGVSVGRELFLMVEIAIALAVAAIPEGLPIVATIASARGMVKMARRNALMHHLAAVETLGSTGVICTDKTGTLTEGSMEAHLAQSWDANEEIDSATTSLSANAARILTIGALCNNATMADSGASGDPLEIALLRAAAAAGLNGKLLEADNPRIGEEAFDADTKMMATYHQHGEEVLVAVKGAPERVMGGCTHYLAQSERRQMEGGVVADWTDKNQKLAEQGFRVLACAEKSDGRDGIVAEIEAFEGLTLLGFIAFRDPPREDVKESIRACRSAGIRVVMITGDQSATASAIAREVGLADGDAPAIDGSDWIDPEDLSDDERQRVLNTVVFARFSPRQKMDLITLLQNAGSVVAMTGDGVSMGLRGTQVAREAADMVLKDDSFVTIVEAIRQYPQLRPLSLGVQHERDHCYHHRIVSDDSPSCSAASNPVPQSRDRFISCARLGRRRRRHPGHGASRPIEKRTDYRASTMV